MTGDPDNEPDDEHDGNGEDNPKCGGKDAKEGPVAPSVEARLAEVTGEQSVVAAVGLPDNVEEVAEQGNGAN